MQLEKFSVAQLIQMLEKKSCPELNALLWRLLPAQKLYEIASFNSEPLQPFNRHILRNCDQKQIDALSLLVESDPTTKQKF